MKNGKCPKCNSDTVYTQPNGVYFGNGNLFVPTSGLTSGSKFVSYICTTCGYFESYVDDPKKLAEVTKNWNKVG